MDATAARPLAKPAGPTFSELFTPKLVTILREGYGWRQFRADAIAGLTVAIVALPLGQGRDHVAVTVEAGKEDDCGFHGSGILGRFRLAVP